MEVLLWALFMLLIMGEALFLDRITGLPAHLTPLLAMLANTLILYVFALADLLLIGWYYVIVMAVVLGVLSIIFLWRAKFRGVTAFPYAVFAGISIVLFIYTRGTTFHSWDEFSHWGLIFRYLMTTQALPTNLNNVIVAYPPASPLWQYFTARIIGFSEANANFAHMLIQFTAVIALFPARRWSDWWKYALALGAALLSAVAVNLLFYKLSVDMLMALLLGVGFAAGLENRFYSRANFVAALLCAITLVLIKPTGILLALIIVMANVVTIFISKIPRRQPGGKISWSFNSLVDYRILLLAVLPVAAYLSWGQFSKNYDVNHVNFKTQTAAFNGSEAFPANIDQYKADLQQQESELRFASGILMQPVQKTMSLSELARMFTIDAPYRTKMIAQKFVAVFSDSPMISTKFTLKMLLVGILILAGVNQLLLMSGKRKTRSINLWVNAALLLGFVVYAVSIYISYVVIFYPVEATGVPSLARYLGTYLLAWLLANLALTYKIATAESAHREGAYAAGVLGVIMGAFLLFLPTGSVLHLPTAPIAAQLETEAIYSKIQQVGFTQQDKVYEVYAMLPTNQGFKHYVMRYLLTPAGSNNEGWLLKKKDDNPLDVYSVDLTPTQWFAILQSQGYTYVLVTKSNADFWNTYSSLFDAYSPDFDQPQLFKVTPDRLEFVHLN